MATKLKMSRKRLEALFAIEFTSAKSKIATCELYDPQKVQYWQGAYDVLSALWKKIEKEEHRAE